MNDPNTDSNTPDDNLSQRDRRRRQHAANKPKVQLNKQDLKKWIGPLALLFLVGGVVGIMMANDSADESVFGCSGHYHYTLDVFIDNEKLLLNAPGDDKFTNVGSNLHMHANTGSGTQLNLVHTHFSGGANQGLHPENCYTYGEAMDTLSMSLRADEIALRAAHGPSWEGTYEVTEGKSLRVFGQGWDDEAWMELDPSTLNDMVPPASSRLAIVFDDADADPFLLLENQATNFPVASYPPDGNPNDPPHYTSFEDLRTVEG